MSHPNLKQLSRAEHLFDTGKLDEALEILNKRDQFEELNSREKAYFLFLKGQILFYQYEIEDLIAYGELLFQEGQETSQNLLSVDGLIFIIFGLIAAERFDELPEITDQAEELLKSVSQMFQKDKLQRKARLWISKGIINFEKGDMEQAERCFNRICGLQNELGITFETVWAMSQIARIWGQARKRFDLAYEYTEKAMSLAKKIKFNHFWIGFLHIFFSGFNAYTGDIDKSLEYSLKGLKIFRSIKNTYMIATLLNNAGGAYCGKGQYDLALKFLEESLDFYEIQGISVDFCLDSLIRLALITNDDDRANKYYRRLEDLYKEKKTDIIEIVLKFNKASILKKSNRIRDIAKAEELFKEVIQMDTIWFEITLDAHIQLCDLLLAEFRSNNNYEVLKEIEYHISQLLAISEKIHSFSYFCETFILKAKLALLNFDMKAARRYLTQSQKIAESKGLKRLAMKISREHDKLVKQLDLWEKLKDLDSPYSERLRLAGLNEQMESMVVKRIIEPPETSNEEPVLLLILSEGGRPFFSKSFIEDKAFESHLFGGFLTTIDYFIREIFSEGLDRAIFGEHTLLMKSIPPFFISYIFKGASYYALQKINYFTEKILKEEDIWQKLLTSFQAGKSIQSNDIPFLESLITETFITK